MSRGADDRQVVSVVDRLLDTSSVQGFLRRLVDDAVHVSGADELDRGIALAVRQAPSVTAAAEPGHPVAPRLLLTGRSS
ncbi:hypothetical protein ACFYZ8_32000 [Streptomyces sp. NPDC001668]|uniref:hypothetical protein n=1 Tax=unclassified Streptomyces TaxID=2593676 RepID=UPI00369D0BDF